MSSAAVAGPTSSTRRTGVSRRGRANATASPAPELSGAESSGIAALIKDYRRFAGGLLWLALVLMILGAIAEGFGLLMIVPLASIAINGGDASLFRFAPMLASCRSGKRFRAALGLFLAPAAPE